MKNLRKILVGIDFSEPSDNALREAARLARWDGADMVILNVLDQEVLKRAGREISIPTDQMVAGAEKQMREHVSEVIGSVALTPTSQPSTKPNTTDAMKKNLI